jgi:guanine nucleotide-binding protein subunit alpha
LNDIERIAARTYEPSDDDVIRARLRTLGVQEYSFWVEQGALTSRSNDLELKPHFSAVQPVMNG